jgi:hypothetical protein
MIAGNNDDNNDEDEAARDVRVNRTWKTLYKHLIDR